MDPTVVEFRCACGVLMVTVAHSTCVWVTVCACGWVDFACTRRHCILYHIAFNVGACFEPVETLQTAHRPMQCGRSLLEESGLFGVTPRCPLVPHPLPVVLLLQDATP